MRGDERKKPDAFRVLPTDTKKGRAVSTPSFSTESLFAGANEILIQHEDDIYRLRITRNSKLILTK